MVTSPCYPTRCKEKGSKRTFNDLTGTLLDGSKRSVMDWILATFLLCLSCSSRRIARELGVHARTGYRGRCWLRKASLSYEIGRQLEGTVAASKDHRWQLAESALMIGSNPRSRNPTRASWLCNMGVSKH